MAKLTLKKVKASLKPFGVKIKKHDGEYCVAYKGSTYYTDDLIDAFKTGMQMVNDGSQYRGRHVFDTAMIDKFAIFDEVDFAEPTIEAQMAFNKMLAEGNVWQSGPAGEMKSPAAIAAHPDFVVIRAGSTYGRGKKKGKKKHKKAGR